MITLCVHKVTDSLPNHFNDVLVEKGGRIFIAAYDMRVRKWYSVDGIEEGITHWACLPKTLHTACNCINIINQ